MEIIYTTQQIPSTLTKSIFLAGPSLRSHQLDQVSWREKALEILEILGYTGTVFVPESESGSFDNLDYQTVHAWETKCLNYADSILFYISRNVDEGILGLTTNNEFGQWMDSGKCILATPPGADSVRYQEAWAKELSIPIYHDLYNALNHIIKEQELSAIKSDGLRSVPLCVYNTNQFKSWYDDLKKAGNVLQEAKVLKTFRAPNGKIFAYAMWANVFITKENRYKNNEFMIGRPDISSCLMYYFRPNPLDCEIVLVSEFRTPVSNNEGMVYELPGGSSFKPDMDNKTIVVDEVFEETGFRLKADKIVEDSSLQLAATMLTHKCHLYTYSLDRYELNQLKMNEGRTFGNESDTELTYLHICKVGDILDKNLLDWSNVGMILKVLNTVTE